MDTVDLSSLVEDFELLNPERALLWPWVLAGAVVLAGLLFWRKRRLSRAGEGLPPEPEAVLWQELRGLKGLLLGEDAVPYLAGVQAALRRYIAARFSVPARALTRRELAARWGQTGLTPEGFEELDAIFEVCDQGKYVGGRMHKADRRLLLSMAFRWGRAVRPRPKPDEEGLTDE